MNEDRQKLVRIIADLDAAGRSYTADQVVAVYSDRTNGCGFISCAKELIGRLGRIGKARTAETYAASLSSFVRFYGECDLPLEDMTASLMAEYEAHLRRSGVCANSSSYYMRNLRAIYNRLVDEGLTEQRFPFRHVYTGIAKTVKRAVPLKDVKRIKELDLAGEPELDHARDMFMMSFYTRGMSIIDMAYLEKSDLSGGVLSYRRKKTGQQLFVKWEEPMQEIVDKYDTEGSPFLLPVIGDACCDMRKRYRNQAHRINRRLKQIGVRLGLSVPLTLYVARHCWASIARSRNIPISVISEGLGHDSEKTTLIYLASLDTAAIDKANSLIMKLL